MAVVLPVFLWSDLESIWHYMQKRTAARTVKEVSTSNYLRDT